MEELRRNSTQELFEFFETLRENKDPKFMRLLYFYHVASLAQYGEMKCETVDDWKRAQMEVKSTGMQ